MIGVSIVETCSHLSLAQSTELVWVSIRVWTCCTGVTYCTAHTDPHYVGPHYVIYCTSILNITILQSLVYTKYHAPVGAWCESKCIAHLHPPLLEGGYGAF